jgi:hypothetical protein
MFSISILFWLYDGILITPAPHYYEGTAPHDIVRPKRRPCHEFLSLRKPEMTDLHDLVPTQHITRISKNPCYHAHFKTRSFKKRQLLQMQAWFITLQKLRILRPKEN